MTSQTGRESRLRNDRRWARVFDRDLSGLCEVPYGQWIPVGLLIALSIPLIFVGLDRYSLVNGDEGIYHAIAEAMVESGDWLRLEFRGTPRPYDTWMNAPLQYWSRALLISALGSNAWTMRLLSASFGLAGVLLTFSFVSAMANRRAGFIAAIAQLTTLQYVFLHSARTGELETATTFFMTLGAWLFVRSLEGKGKWKGSWVAHHLCLFVLLNLKLPIVLIAVLAELSCFALVPAARPHFKRWVWTGLALAPIGLAWHIGQGVAHWDEFMRVMGEMAGGAEGAERGRLVRFYARVVLFGGFPYSLFYPLAMVSVLVHERSGEQLRRWIVLAAYACAVFFFYFNVGQHYRWYIIPAYPFLCAFVGVWLSEISDRIPGRVELAYTGAALSLMIWLRAGPWAYDPFARAGVAAPMRMSWWASGDGPDAIYAVGVAATALVAAAALFGLVRASRARFSPRVGAGLVLLLVGFATIRVFLPLQHLDHRSPIAALRDEIDARVEGGESLVFPIPVPRGNQYVVRFYFQNDFELERVRRDQGHPESYVQRYGHHLVRQRVREPSGAD